MFVIYAYDEDLSKIGTTVEVDEGVGLQMISQGRARATRKPAGKPKKAPAKRPAAKPKQGNQDGGPVSTTDDPPAGERSDGD